MCDCSNWRHLPIFFFTSPWNSLSLPEQSGQICKQVNNVQEKSFWIRKGCIFPSLPVIFVEIHSSFHFLTTTVVNRIPFRSWTFLPFGITNIKKDPVYNFWNSLIFPSLVNFFLGLKNNKQKTFQKQPERNGAWSNWRRWNRNFCLVVVAE